MLDDLLGRTELRERIKELEAERDRLAAQLEAESERRAAAVRDRQTAEEQRNRLEDRIADLEGQLERRSESIDHPFRHETSLRGRRLETVLSRLESFESDPESVLTAFVDDETPSELENLLGVHAALVSRAAPCYVVADDAGLLAVAIRPPIAPSPFVEWASHPRIERERLQPTGRFALALVRSDTFAVGVYEGESRLEYEGFTSDVKSDHSKGGFSQSRFERIRDEQIADHIRRCETVLDGLDADRLYVVGDRRLIEEFDATATDAVDATGEPESALTDAFEAFWTVRLYGL